MSADFLIKGFIIGFSVAAPVGPIGVLTIKRTLSEGRTSGFVTGLGAAMADTIYGLIAGFGLTAISSFLLSYQLWMQLVGGLFLIVIGIKSLLSQPATQEANIKSNGLLKNFFSTFLLTITNPATILSFLAIFAALGLANAKTDNASSISLVLGVFIGSALWWFILSSLVSVFTSKINTERLKWINKGSGIMILSFGLYALYACVK